ncbi:nicotinate phosphoribosyltransferase [Ornithinimicrobium murale]|uniref:nicotinate phosphoribosyltransferase n=1 Tax=Ornithinimicrobium murale TaxID=1050153 RepID=UPI000E0D0A8D|nr:nicotinate phosphoribosyltransferase [Ornithinimicrobium murale]
MSTPALHTDQYELTMLSSFVETGLVIQDAAFELFARRLPAGRRFGMVAGLGRFLDSLDGFRFEDAQVNWLLSTGKVTPLCAGYLRDWTFTGDIDAYPEGSTYWPNSPVLSVRGKLGDGLVLETLALSMFNHDSAIASAAARMVHAAGRRPLIEMGSRRVHEEGAVAAARAAYIAGFEATSNLEAGFRHDIPVVGTAAHAFTLAHTDELTAFRAQLSTHGVTTSLLVDTYDTSTGIRNAVRAANEIGADGPGAIRLDSGDLLEEAHRARILLDTLGATHTKIVVTSDLDEYVITDLAGGPIDSYGVGTRLATGSGHPTAGMVYKLVEVNGRPVAKKAAGKGGTGGAKTAYRLADGTEGYSLDGSVPAGAATVAVPVVRSGQVLEHADVHSARAHAAQQLVSLPPAALQVSDGAAYRTCTPKTTRITEQIEVAS